MRPAIPDPAGFVIVALPTSRTFWRLAGRPPAMRACTSPAPTPSPGNSSRSSPCSGCAAAPPASSRSAASAAGPRCLRRCTPRNVAPCRPLRLVPAVRPCLGPVPARRLGLRVVLVQPGDDRVRRRGSRHRPRSGAQGSSLSPLASRSSTRSSGRGSTCIATKGNPSSVSRCRTRCDFGHHSAW